jgi:hypothetical protein
MTAERSTVEILSDCTLVESVTTERTDTNGGSTRARRTAPLRGGSRASNQTRKLGAVRNEFAFLLRHA